MKTRIKVVTYYDGSQDFICQKRLGDFEWTIWYLFPILGWAYFFGKAFEYLFWDEMDYRETLFGMSMPPSKPDRAVFADFTRCQTYVQMYLQSYNDVKEQKRRRVARTTIKAITYLQIK